MWPWGIVCASYRIILNEGCRHKNSPVHSGAELIREEKQLVFFAKSIKKSTSICRCFRSILHDTFYHWCRVASRCLCSVVRVSFECLLKMGQMINDHIQHFEFFIDLWQFILQPGILIDWVRQPGFSRDLHIVPYTFTSGFFSPNFSLSVSQISPRSLPCFSMLLMVL